MQLHEPTVSIFRNSSQMAETLIPSEIIKLASEIHHKIQSGEEVFNLTIGDFNPKIFPIPKSLETYIIEAYKQGHTNYPVANGMNELRQAISELVRDCFHLHYTADEILVSGGARPLIYAVYKTLVDPDDVVLFPVPSWNNNHYCHLAQARGIAVEVTAEANFMPTADDFRPFIREATMIALCSPQNPTGTVFSRESLQEISELVLEENKRRKGIQKPLYIMYDQVYSQLCFDETVHHDPVGLVPELRDYVIYIDGLSKMCAATGLRVGWAFGPKTLIDKMRTILSHIGAWAPKAEQIATAHFLRNRDELNNYMDWFRPEIYSRLTGLFNGIMKLKAAGYPIDAIYPHAAIYLTVRCPWVNSSNRHQLTFNTQKDVTAYILDHCKVAMVPFKAFGSSEHSDWYRISVGTMQEKEIDCIIASLKSGMDQLA